MSQDFARPHKKINLLLRALPVLTAEIQKRDANTSLDATLVGIGHEVENLKQFIGADTVAVSTRCQIEKDIILLIIEALTLCEALCNQKAFTSSHLTVGRWQSLEALVRSEKPELPPLKSSQVDTLASTPALENVLTKLRDLSGQEPSAKSGLTDAEVGIPIKSVRDSVTTLVGGMGHALRCECEGTDVHGGLLFLKSHIRDGAYKESVDEFSLLVSQGIPDASPWVFLRSDVNRYLQPILLPPLLPTVPP
jgi:hypothetical protein